MHSSLRPALRSAPSSRVVVACLSLAVSAIACGDEAARDGDDPAVDAAALPPSCQELEHHRFFQTPGGNLASDVGWEEENGTLTVKEQIRECDFNWTECESASTYRVACVPDPSEEMRWECTCHRDGPAQGTFRTDTLCDFTSERGLRTEASAWCGWGG